MYLYADPEAEPHADEKPKHYTLRLSEEMVESETNKRSNLEDTVNSRYLEFQGTLWSTSRYPYLDISELQNWGKNSSNNHI